MRHNYHDYKGTRIHRCTCQSRSDNAHWYTEDKHPTGIYYGETDCSHYATLKDAKEAVENENKKG